MTETICLSKKEKIWTREKSFLIKNVLETKKPFWFYWTQTEKRNLPECFWVLNYFILASFNLFDPLFHLMDRTHYLLPGTEPPVTPMKDVKGIRHKLGAKTIFLKALVIMTISNMTLLLMTISFLHTNYSKTYKITLV